jgi:flagellar basal-body rod protein FlgB
VVHASSMLDLLQGYLQATTERQQLITANMANIDTPGYKTRDLGFEQALQRAIGDSERFQLAPITNKVPGLPERADGNNVNLDRESVALSETQIQYQLGVQLVKSQFSELLTAIKDSN